ncbi:hypothetical protein D0864_16930, partial [Hortaea werneckii]
AGGTIVVVNASTVRSDALVITSQAIRLIRLRNFDVTKVREWLVEIRSWSSEPRNPERFGRQNTRYRAFLVWLWKNCVRDILKEIGYSTPPSTTDRPRIWWVGTGVASSLPFHAAGTHSQGSTSNTFSRAISSYAPTLRALIHAKGRATEFLTGSRPKHNLLLATMETTPGFRRLYGALAEADAVQEAVGVEHRITHRKQQNAEAVLRLMSSHDIFHFAGHGDSDPADPSGSCIILEKADPTSHLAVEDPLCVRDLFEADFQPAFLAFLSACSTAENQHHLLADESIHLVSGFLVAGFRHVVGCLWPSSDEVCVQVAREFYRALGLQDGKEVRDETVARALHAAVEKVRATRPHHPLLWAQYVHVGA